MGPEFSQSLHPGAGEFSQGSQLARLGIRAKELEVFSQRLLQHLVVGQRGARGQAQQLERLVLGRPVFQTILGDQAGGRGGKAERGVVHGVIVPAAQVAA